MIILYVVQIPDGGGVELQIRPPLLLDNALPMPLGITVWDDDTLLTRYCWRCSVMSNAYHKHVCNLY